MFAAGELATKARKGEIHIIDPSTIEDLGGNKSSAKKLANKYDYFLSEVPHMGLVGRYLGVVLGPRGKCLDCTSNSRSKYDGCRIKKHRSC